MEEILDSQSQGHLQPKPQASRCPHCHRLVGWLVNWLVGKLVGWSVRKRKFPVGFFGKSDVSNLKTNSILAV